MADGLFSNAHPADGNPAADFQSALKQLEERGPEPFRPAPKPVISPRQAGYYEHIAYAGEHPHEFKRPCPFCTGEYHDNEVSEMAMEFAAWAFPQSPLAEKRNKEQS